ncbi:S1C family serine protease [Blautia hydrogenotrophica]|uniref:PDZ domain-containing protein n=2 Tax=Blautia hydrogenotrophica TaxID=53443 RepID=C0CQF0_BLAHS|nr:PDZ/DHR/GLGF domain protein [Blautia hydrogenotrophica DSM 10507]
MNMSDERYEIQQTNQNVYQANETEGENFEREYEKGARNSSETGPELGKPKKGKKPYLKENHKRLLKRAAALALSGVLLGGAAGVSFVAVNRIAQDSSEAEKVVSSTPTLQTAADTKDGNIKGQSLDVSDIASATMPSIVSITNKSVQEVQNYFDMFGMGGQMQEQEVESAGSGIIVGQNDTELLIVTNNHVVENADTLSVAFVDNEVYEAAIKGTDADNDLAVVAVKLEEISDDTMSEIKAIQLGDSENLQVGEQVVAIGNALGYGQSVTTGIVSAVDRQLDEASCNLIQTDAAINPGNSGGALLNMQGQLVGINSAKLASTEVEGMGYAIPVSVAQPIMEDLMSRTTREKVSEDQASSIGIKGVDVDSETAETYGMPQGAYVAEVNEGSAAEKAGLKEGMIITKFDGTSVKSMSDLKAQLAYYAAGETVNLTVSVADNGEYQEKDLQITLDAADKTEETNSEQEGENSFQENFQGFQGDGLW